MPSHRTILARIKVRAVPFRQVVSGPFNRNGRTTRFVTPRCQHLSEQRHIPNNTAVHAFAQSGWRVRKLSAAISTSRRQPQASRPRARNSHDQQRGTTHDRPLIYLPIQKYVSGFKRSNIQESGLFLKMKLCLNKCFRAHAHTFHHDSFLAWHIMDAQLLRHSLGDRRLAAICPTISVLKL